MFFVLVFLSKINVVSTIVFFDKYSAKLQKKKSDWNMFFS